jgi:hypothetical protein
MGFNGNITQVMNEIFGDFDGDASNIVLDGWLIKINKSYPYNNLYKK